MDYVLHILVLIAIYATLAVSLDLLVPAKQGFCPLHMQHFMDWVLTLQH